MYAIINKSGLVTSTASSAVNEDDLKERGLTAVECPSNTTPGMTYREGVFSHPDPEPLTVDQVYALRAAAYADPQNGSDRHFLEAARKTAEGDTAGADAATQAGLERVAEIKAEYPLVKQ